MVVWKYLVDESVSLCNDSWRDEEMHRIFKDFLLRVARRLVGEGSSSGQQVFTIDVSYVLDKVAHIIPIEQIFCQ